MVWKLNREQDKIRLYNSAKCQDEENKIRPRFKCMRFVDDDRSRAFM